MSIKLKGILIALVLMLSSIASFAVDNNGKKCLKDQCLKGGICEAKAELEMPCKGNIRKSVSGTQTRTATCENGKGWKYSDWSGSCECKKLYEWNGLFCQQNNIPEIETKCAALPNVGGDASHTMIIARTKEPLEGDLGVNLILTLGFRAPKEAYKKAYEYHYIDVAVNIILHAGDKKEQTKEMDIGIPVVCATEKVCEYYACEAVLQEAKWINI